MSEAIDLNRNHQAKVKILVAIPCLNEEKTIQQVIDSSRDVVSHYGSVEVFVINDGSSDGTKSKAENAGATVFSHHSSRGVGTCFQRALNYAIETNVDILVTIDGDGQFDASDIPSLITPICEGRSDFVTGSRFCGNQEKPEHMSSLKFWGNHRVSELVSSLAGEKFYDVSCGFRAYSKEAILWLNLHGQFTYTHETFLDMSFKGLQIAEVPISVKYFEGRKSRVAKSIPKYALQSLSIMMRSYRDYQPLKFFWIIAAAVSIPATLLAVFFFGHFLLTDKFSPHLWAGMSAGFLFVVSLVFFVLGILADAQGRIRINQERTLYLLKKLSSRGTLRGDLNSTDLTASNEQLRE